MTWVRKPPVGGIDWSNLVEVRYYRGPLTCRCGWVIDESPGAAKHQCQENYLADFGDEIWANSTSVSYESGEVTFAKIDGGWVCFHNRGDVE